MQKQRKILGNKDKLIKDLIETTLSCRQLGKKYGVSRQRIQSFCKEREIKRPKRPKGHQINECPICQKLIRINKKLHSEFISSDTIQKQAGFNSKGKYLYHLQILRGKGLLKKKFGRLHSKRAEKAFAIYFKKGLAIDRIGKKFGYKNFGAFIRKYRELGWNVPPSLYVYNWHERSRIRTEIERRKKRQRKVGLVE